MTEKIGQYYFEVEQGHFVNKGKMVEFDGCGRERFSFKQKVLTKSAITLTALATFTGALSLIWQLPPEVHPLVRIGAAVIVPNYAGFFVMELLESHFKIVKIA